VKLGKFLRNVVNISRTPTVGGCTGGCSSLKEEGRMELAPSFFF
jgi:hypothetical protein